ncbi:hypothetical protein SLE2022_368760 [Rubroshorea leprosula]
MQIDSIYTRIDTEIQECAKTIPLEDDPGTILSANTFQTLKIDSPANRTNHKNSQENQRLVAEKGMNGPGKPKYKKPMSPLLLQNFPSNQTRMEHEKNQKETDLEAKKRNGDELTEEKSLKKHERDNFEGDVQWDKGKLRKRELGSKRMKNFNGVWKPTKSPKTGEKKWKVKIEKLIP